MGNGSVAAPATSASRFPTVLERTGLPRHALLLAVAGSFLVGLALRIWRLGARPLSFDEAYTFATVQRPFFDMLDAFRFEANGTLYALVLWPLLRISESEEMVRLPALVAGIATIPATYWAGREFLGRRPALVGSAFVALSPALIGWSAYGRAYAFSVLFAVLSFGCLARALSAPRGTRRWHVLHVLTLLATGYSSAIAAVTLLPVHTAVVAWRGLAQLRTWLVAASALAAGLLPLAVLLRVESTYRDPLAWLWEPDAALLERVGGELALGPAFLGDAGGALAASLLLTLAAVMVAGLLAPGSARTFARWEVQAVVSWALLPPTVLFLVSEIRPMLWARYLSMSLPACALLVALLLVRASRAVAIVTSSALASLFLVASLLTPAPPNDFRGLGSWVEAHRSTSAPLFIYPVEQLPAVAYYAPTLRVDGRVPVGEWRDTALPAGVVGHRRSYDWGTFPARAPNERELARASSRTGSVVVLTYPNLVHEIPIAWTARDRCTLDWGHFDGLTAISITGCRAGAPARRSRPPNVVARGSAGSERSSVRRR